MGIGQFYLSYLNKALNRKGQYAIYVQKIYDMEFIIKHICYNMFYKRMFYYIQIKENYYSEKDKIIEEEKDEGSYESNSKNDKTNNNKEIINENNNNSNYSSIKENNESHDEIKILKTTFNIIQ